MSVLGIRLDNRLQCLFEPRILDHDRRKIGMKSIQHPDVVDDVYDTRENMEGYNPELVVLKTVSLFLEHC